jgi:GT2 family glycosyltransferase/glycosyltransferase involved in cell wall biosynthesis
MAKSQEASERVRVLSQDISERDGRIAGLLGDLEEARERARSLDKAVSEREGRIAGLLGDLEEAGERSRSLDQAVSEREGRIGELLGDLEEARERSRSLDQAVSERERKNQAITEELKQSRNCAKKLDQKVLEQDKRISILNEEVQKINERALSLELMMSEKDGRIAALIEQLNQSENRALWLENEISDMRRSVVWTLTMKYHNTFVERLLPTNTRKRNCYDRGIKGLRIIVNEGWGLFWCKFNEYRGSRKYTEDIEASIEERILNHSKNILSENNQISQESTKYGSSAISNPEYFLKDYIRSRLLSFLSETSNELQFAKYEYPIVSIIILTYNKVGYTFQCLESILSNTDMEYEVIIVDNGSSDETTNLLNKLLNINVIRNDDNLGFILGCNMGASVSKGRYLLFLNNDIVVTPRWLSKLVNTIESNSSIGAVGCKLIWPNGLLQEAGSIIWSDGSALGYGRGDNPLSPEYSYIRRVDYCSGACLLVRRDVFEGLGGFDERYIPAYYEDSDLCIAIQESGYDVVYQPNVTVFHHEFTSSSPENAKKLMESNRLKFVEKWGNVLETKYFPSLDNVISARDVSQRPKILVLDDRIPAPYQGSGFPRAYEMLRIISELGFKTTFYPLDKTIPWQPATNELQQAGIEVIYGERLAFTEFAKERSNFYDIVLVSRPHNMEKTLPVIKDYFPRAKLVYDAEAIFSTREILKASVRGSSLDKTQIENMVSKEMNLMENADLVITVSEREKKTIEERGYLKPVGVWGHSIIPKNTESGFHERRDLLFVGSFLASDSPNEDAILYFVKEIFPTIKKEISCRLFIVGINPPESVKKLASSSIIVTGYVDDITEYYEKCRVFVVPHRFSAGIPLKLEEAMSYGIPAVVSELTASQLNLVDGHEVLVAKDADEFAKKIIKLYKNEDLWNLIRSNSLKSIQIRCNPILMEQKLKQILEGIV